MGALTSGQVGAVSVFPDHELATVSCPCIRRDWRMAPRFGLLCRYFNDVVLNYHQKRVIIHEARLAIDRALFLKSQEIKEVDNYVQKWAVAFLLSWGMTPLLL